jgi:hypothetical protein
MHGYIQKWISETTPESQRIQQGGNAITYVYAVKKGMFTGYLMTLYELHCL